MQDPESATWTSERLNLDRSHAEESHQEANRKAKEPQQKKTEPTQDSRGKTAARQRKEEINPKRSRGGSEKDHS